MIRLLTILIVLFFPGCTITVRPIPASSNKQHHKTHSRHYPSSRTTKPTPTAVPNNVKETWWIENYHKLESAHGDYVIPDDANIKPLPDGRFRVPDRVLTHYQDLLLATPSPHQ